MKSLDNFAKDNHTFVVAHRGSSGTAPENTCAAFRIAMEAGAAMIETDVRLSADNKVVIFHDDNFYRTAGATGSTHNMTYDEIKKIDVGSNFSPEFAGETTPLLSEVLEMTDDKAYLNIEIKTQPNDDYSFKIKKVIEEIYKAEAQNRVILCSFDYDFLREIKRADKMLPTASIKRPGDNRLPSEIAWRTGATSYVCSIDEINDDIAADAGKHDIITGVYSFDKAEQLQIAYDYNVRAIATNFPEKIIKELTKAGKI
ncbi:MAG: glycerophosphodiester phosphodiesterase family protein [Candidatus Kapabacteria bacterium]|jgi:glycerophosphoryl diester phosphodiesterase|nr:glycerophosphodiester phosphodiesterase family protein [Candidatus Kapabacteria bacterium]